MTFTEGEDCLQRGEALRQAGQLDAALALFRRAVECRHDDVAALAAQGELHLDLDQREDAADCFELARAFQPDYVPALRGLARMHREAGDGAGALSLLNQAHALAPADPHVLFELGAALNALGEWPEAQTRYEQACRIDPGNAAAWVNLGMIHLAQAGRPRQAQDCFERAVALQPGLAAAQVDLGLALQDQGRTAEALAHYEKLIARDPGEIEYAWHRGQLLLAQGDFARGWADYELRVARGERSVAREFPFPIWNGQALDGRCILVHGEQGLGDEIMFASCLAEVMARAKDVVLECDHRLAALFRRSFPAAVVYGAKRGDPFDWVKGFPEIGTQLPIGSLPLHFRTTRSDFLPAAGYLIADPFQVEEYRRRLAAHGACLKIGIAWRGGTAKTRRTLRTAPLSQWPALLGGGSAAFFNLQYGDITEEVSRAYPSGNSPLLDLDDRRLDDMDAVAAMITALDLVITVDNTIAHLAGALGKPVWTLLPQVADWRYLARGETMPWYGAMRLFRQQRAGDWGEVMERLAREIGSFAGAGSA